MARLLGGVELGGRAPLDAREPLLERLLLRRRREPCGLDLRPRLLEGGLLHISRVYLRRISAISPLDFAACSRATSSRLAASARTSVIFASHSAALACSLSSAAAAVLASAASAACEI